MASSAFRPAVTVPGASREDGSGHQPQNGKLPMPMRIAVILGLGVACWAPIVLLLT